MEHGPDGCCGLLRIELRERPRAYAEAARLAERTLAELHIVESMHERTQPMADLSDAFIGLPGGAGVLEEIAEQWTWAQLTIHIKPCGFLDVARFWAPMRQMLDTMVGQGFVRVEQPGIVSFDDDLDALLSTLAAPPSWTGAWGAREDRRRSRGCLAPRSRC